MRHALKGKRRCRLHGGCSTGPRDWRANVAAMRAGRKSYIEERHAYGLKAPGGRPPGPRGKQARFQYLVEKVVAALPPAPIDKPLEQWSHGEILADGARSGLLRLRQFAQPPARALTARAGGHPTIAGLHKSVPVPMRDAVNGSE
jgi:hypothetical protein